MNELERIDTGSIDRSDTARDTRGEEREVGGWVGGERDRQGEDGRRLIGETESNVSRRASFKSNYESFNWRSN